VHVPFAPRNKLDYCSSTCIDSKSARQNKPREERSCKAEDLALAILAIRKVTMFPRLRVSNCAQERDSGLSNVTFGNTAVSVTRYIGTVQSVRIHRQPVVSQWPPILSTVLVTTNLYRWVPKIPRLTTYANASFVRCATRIRRNRSSRHISTPLGRFTPSSQLKPAVIHNWAIGYYLKAGSAGLDFCCLTDAGQDRVDMCYVLHVIIWGNNNLVRNFCGVA
jgi:hypothetical protein